MAAMAGESDSVNSWVEDGQTVAWLFTASAGLLTAAVKTDVTIKSRLKMCQAPNYIGWVL